MVPRWRFLATFLRPVFSTSRVKQVSDLHLKFALRPHHVYVEVWQTFNLRRLRLGEEKKEELEMWANAQRDGRPAEYRWRPLFNAAVWLCSNASKTRNPLKFRGCPKLTKRSQPLAGQSSPYCKDMWGRYCCLTSFFSDCRYVP